MGEQIDHDTTGKVQRPSGVSRLLTAWPRIGLDGRAVDYLRLRMGLMVNPSLNGWGRTQTILGRMFPAALPGTALVLVGLTFVMLCVFYAVFGSSRLRPTVRSFSVLLGVLLVPTIVLF